MKNAIAIAIIAASLIACGPTDAPILIDEDANLVDEGYFIPERVVGEYWGPSLDDRRDSVDSWATVAHPFASDEYTFQVGQKLMAGTDVEPGAFRGPQHCASFGNSHGGYYPAATGVESRSIMPHNGGIFTAVTFDVSWRVPREGEVFEVFFGLRRSHARVDDSELVGFRVRTGQGAVELVQGGDYEETMRADAIDELDTLPKHQDSIRVRMEYVPFAVGGTAKSQVYFMTDVNPSVVYGPIDVESVGQFRNIIAIGAGNNGWRGELCLGNMNVTFGTF